jgi:hypothetical protein
MTFLLGHAPSQPGGDTDIEEADNRQRIDGEDPLQQAAPAASSRCRRETREETPPMRAKRLVTPTVAAGLATAALWGAPLAGAGTQSVRPSGEIIAILKHSPSGQIIAVLKHAELVGLLKHPEMRKAGGDAK